jgi:hypothetical protein
LPRQACSPRGLQPIRPHDQARTFKKRNRIEVSRQSPGWELPFFSDQEKTRGPNHLSA